MESNPTGPGESLSPFNNNVDKSTATDQHIWDKHEFSCVDCDQGFNVTSGNAIFALNVEKKKDLQKYIKVLHADPPQFSYIPYTPFGFLLVGIFPVSDFAASSIGSKMSLL